MEAFVDIVKGASFFSVRVSLSHNSNQYTADTEYQPKSGLLKFPAMGIRYWHYSIFVGRFVNHLSRSDKESVNTTWEIFAKHFCWLKVGA